MRKLEEPEEEAPDSGVLDRPIFVGVASRVEGFGHQLPAPPRARSLSRKPESDENHQGQDEGEEAQYGPLEPQS